jgi:hypothetical protein
MVAMVVVLAGAAEVALPQVVVVLVMVTAERADAAKSGYGRIR